MSDHSINLEDLAHSRNGHSVFAPSSSAMWLTCSGSLIPNLLAPDDAGQEAAEGTVAHGVAEQWLKSGLKPRHLIGEVEWVEAGDWGYSIEIDEVMLDFVQQYVDWCAFLPGQHYVEQKVYFSQLTPIPKQGGTADHVACQPGKMVITDLKYGKGVRVYAKGNTQARLYALGFFYEWDWLYDFQEIQIRIAQPRLDSFDEWTISRDELLAFADHVKERAALAWKVSAPRTPSPDACRWCRVRSTCAASAKLMFDLTEGVFSNIDVTVDEESIAEFRDNLDTMSEPRSVNPMELTTADLAAMYGWRGFVESWWKAMSNELLRRSSRGEQIPHYKLVEGRSRRTFRYPNDAGKHLVSLGVPRNQVFVEEVCSPAEAEKLLRKSGYKGKDLEGLLDGHIYKPPGKPTLVPEHDKRPALVEVSASAFQNLDDECVEDE